MKREVHFKSPDKLFGSPPKIGSPPKKRKNSRKIIYRSVYKNMDNSGNNTLETSKIRRHQREEKCCIVNSYVYVQLFYNKYQWKLRSEMIEVIFEDAVNDRKPSLKKETFM